MQDLLTLYCFSSTCHQDNPKLTEEPDMTSCIIDCWWPWQQPTTTINYPVYATTIYDHKVTNPEGGPNKASGPSKISSSWTCSLPGFWERVLDLSGTTHRLNQHPTLIGCELALGTLSGPHPCPNRLEGLQLSLLVSRGMGKNCQWRWKVQVRKSVRWNE